MAPKATALTQMATLYSPNSSSFVKSIKCRYTHLTFVECVGIQFENVDDGSVYEGDSVYWNEEKDRIDDL
jgi:hypothetical protein